MFDVGCKAVEAFLSFSLNLVVFEGEMNFDESIADYADNIIRFDKSVVFISTQELYAMCSFDFAKIILNVARHRPIVSLFVDFMRHICIYCVVESLLIVIRNMLMTLTVGVMFFSYVIAFEVF